MEKRSAEEGRQETNEAGETKKEGTPHGGVTYKGNKRVAICGMMKAARQNI